MREQFVGDGSEGVRVLRRCSEPCEALLLAWVEAIIQEPLGFVAASAGVLERYARKGANGELSLLAIESVGQIPKLRARWLHPKLKTLAVGQFQDASGGCAGVANLLVSERHLLASASSVRAWGQQ